MPPDLSPCPGCGGLFPDRDGPVHRYMTSSPGCWAAYGEVLAREYSTPALMPVHRLSVDAYAVQHPGDGWRPAVQSVGLHLARLLLQLDHGLAGPAANAVMLELGKRKAELPRLQTHRAPALTVADVVCARSVPAHLSAVQGWAEAAAEQWAEHRDSIRRWAEPALRGLGKR